MFFGNLGCENIAGLEFPAHYIRESLCSQARLFKGCFGRKQAESVFVDAFMQNHADTKCLLNLTSPFMLVTY